MKKGFQADVDSDEQYTTKFTYEYEEVEAIDDDKLEFSINKKFGDMLAMISSVEVSLLDQTFTCSVDKDNDLKQTFEFVRSKNLLRTIERKRVNVTLSKPKTGMFGVFGGSEPFGKCSFKLDALAKSARVEQTVDITAYNSRKVLRGCFNE
jgi:hypothetical protein